MRALLLLAAAVLASAGCAARPPASTGRDAPASIVVLHTNDTHGHVWGRDGTGSAAQRATLVERIRSEAETRGAAVILLDAGDVRTGTYCSDRQAARPDFEAMAVMGYDAMVVGNHEFDLPYATTVEQRDACPFPWLGANVLSPETGEPAFEPTTVLERGGIRIGVLGLVTAETPTTSTRGAEAPVTFEDPTEVARRLLPGLRDRSDLVVVLSHLGLREDRALATEVPGIDLIVGGHSHSALEQPEVVGRTVIAHAGDDGRLLGRVDLEVGHGGARLVAGALLPVTMDLEAAPDVSEVLARYDCPEAREVVARANEAITRADLHGPGTSSAMANLVGEAFRAAADAEVALLNRGGLRADLPAGEITFGHVHSVLPFDNRLVVLEATGDDLISIARGVAARGRRGRGLLMPSGMDWVLGPGGEATVTIGGQPPAPERRYRLVVSTFLAEGGDRHPRISGLPRIEDLEISPRTALEGLLRSTPQLSCDRRSPVSWTGESPVPE